MLDIVVLGTAGSTPTKHCNVSGNFIKYEGISLLYDCGENTQQNIKKWDLDFFVDYIILSHAHLDHIGGLIPYLSSMNLINRLNPLIILKPSNLNLDSQLQVLGVTSYTIEVRNIVLSSTIKIGSQLQVSFIKSNHSTLTYGLRLCLPEAYTLDSKKLQKEGLFPGKSYALLKAGYPIQHETRVYSPEDYRSIKRSALSVILTSDTRPYTASQIKQKCDLLIHECTYYDDLKKAQENKHSAFKELNHLYKLTHHLALTHFGAEIWARYSSLKNTNSLTWCRDGQLFSWDSYKTLSVLSGRKL